MFSIERGRAWGCIPQLGTAGGSDALFINDFAESVVFGPEVALPKSLRHAVQPIDVGNAVMEIAGDGRSSFSAIAIRLARGSYSFEVVGLDVFHLELAVHFPAATMVGSEALALVVDVEG